MLSTVVAQLPLLMSNLRKAETSVAWNLHFKIEYNQKGMKDIKVT